jgi:hypothetical protein
MGLLRVVESLNWRDGNHRDTETQRKRRFEELFDVAFPLCLRVFVVAYSPSFIQRGRVIPLIGRQGLLNGIG